MEYNFKYYLVRAAYDPNGDVYNFVTVTLSKREYERHIYENGWCHFLFETYDIDRITTIAVLFLNEEPFTTVPISVLLSQCPEFEVYPSYFVARDIRDPDDMLDENDICVGGNLYEYLHPSASAVGTRGNEQGEDK